MTNDPTFNAIQRFKAEAHSVRAGFIRVTLDAASLFAAMARTEEKPERLKDLLARARAGYDAALRSYRRKTELADRDWQLIVQRFEDLRDRLHAFDAAEVPVSGTLGSILPGGGPLPAPSRQYARVLRGGKEATRVWQFLQPGKFRC